MLNLLPELESKDAVLYSYVGKALFAAQRVEFLSKIVEGHLLEFDSIYKITSESFQKNAIYKSENIFRCLGQIFRYLKLNPNLIPDHLFDTYIENRNYLVHEFSIELLRNQSQENLRKATLFCIEFSRHSDFITKYFKGLLFYLILRQFGKENMDPAIQSWTKDYQFFIDRLK